MSENVIEVNEPVVELSFGKDTKRGLKEVMESLDEHYKRFMMQKYSDMKVGLARGEKEELKLVVFGLREETPDETKARLAKEEAKQKFVEEQELKEYLRLKRKYGKE